MSQECEELQQCARILSTESAGEIILARISDGCFFGLGQVGTLIWTRLAQPATVADVIAYLEQACGPLPDTAANDVGGFIEELRREGLLEPASAEAPGAAPAMLPQGQQVYAPPRLDRGTLRHAASGNITFYDGGLTESNNPGGLS